MPNIFFCCQKHCDRGIIIVIVNYFQIWNKNEHNIIISRVISSHIGPMYIETPYNLNALSCLFIDITLCVIIIYVCIWSFLFWVFFVLFFLFFCMVLCFVFCFFNKRWSVHYQNKWLKSVDFSFFFSSVSLSFSHRFFFLFFVLIKKKHIN